MVAAGYAVLRDQRDDDNIIELGDTNAFGYDYGRQEHGWWRVHIRLVLVWDAV